MGASRSAEQREDGLNKQLQTTREQAGKTTEQLYAEARKLLESDDWEAKEEGEEKLAALDMRWTWARTRGGGNFCRLLQPKYEQWADNKGKQPPENGNYDEDDYEWRIGPLYTRNVIEDASSEHDDLLMLTGGPWWGIHMGNEWRINHLMMDGRISDLNKEVRGLGTDDTCLAFQTRRQYATKTPFKPVEKEFPEEDLRRAAKNDEAEYERLKANFLQYATIPEMDEDYTEEYEKAKSAFKKSRDLRVEERLRQQREAEQTTSSAGILLAVLEGDEPMETAAPAAPAESEEFTEEQKRLRNEKKRLKARLDKAPEDAALKKQVEDLKKKVQELPTSYPLELRR